MNMPIQSDNNRLEELLAGRALGDLTDDESAELSNLLRASPDLDTDEFDRVAAALAAGHQLDEPLPDALSQKIRNDAPAYLPGPTPDESRSTFSVRESIAWTLAVACLLVILIREWPGHSTTPDGKPSLSAQRQELIDGAEDTIVARWERGLHPFGNAVGGDVVWSNAQQRGFMRFKNMPVNNPMKEQYQLWIIDPTRDDKPIDGGVFDVTSSGEVIVPIDAKLNINSPRVFAITIEKPGGVVVSKQERLPLLAKVERAL